MNYLGTSIPSIREDRHIHNDPTQGNVVRNGSLPWMDKIVNIDSNFFSLQCSRASLLLGSFSSPYSENIINIHFLKKKSKENIIQAI